MRYVIERGCQNPIVAFFPYLVSSSVLEASSPMIRSVCDGYRFARAFKIAVGVCAADPERVADQSSSPRTGLRQRRTG
jgi:hypothetical protein